MKNRLTKIEEKDDTVAELKHNKAIFSRDDVPERTSGEVCKQIIRELVANKFRKVVASSDIESVFRAGKLKTDYTDRLP